jgi:two-component system LytT family response regulator
VGGEPKRDSLLWGSLFLLDIQMPGMTGFDVLRLLDGPSPAVIFTTAYDHYAVQAFEVSAIDYLLKPIAQARLTQALDKVILLGEKKEPTDWNDKIETVLDKLVHPEYAKRLAVKHLERVHLLDCQQIRYIVSEHRLVTIYAQDGQKYWTNENLSQLAGRLDPDKFMRIHRSAIIFLEANFEVESFNSGRLKLHFLAGNNDGSAQGNSEDQTLVVSRENVAGLRVRLGF